MTSASVGLLGLTLALTPAYWLRIWAFTRPFRVLLSWPSICESTPGRNLVPMNRSRVLRDCCCTSSTMSWIVGSLVSVADMSEVRPCRTLMMFP